MSASTVDPHAATMVLIEERLKAAIDCEAVDVVNESHLHVGHAGAASGGGHFQVTVIANAFANLNTLARHRLIYGALGDAMYKEIHALGINALTPDEFA